jgi:hypothetical protein
MVYDEVSMKKRTDFHKVIVGRAEELSFPELDMLEIPAKVDTGAYRSAVHASDIRVDPQTGQLSFMLLGGHPVCGVMATRVQTDDFKQVTIANSFGQEEKRYEVRLRVKLGPKIFWARFTLADRSKKIYPILIGRKLLNGRFVVDTDETSINRIELKAKYGIAFPKDEEEGRE